MACSRELQNIGYIYPEEQELARSSDRQKRARITRVKYGFDSQAEDGTEEVVTTPVAPKRKRQPASSNEKAAKRAKTDEVKTPKAARTSASESEPKTPTSLPRTRSSQAGKDSAAQPSPKRQKLADKKDTPTIEQSLKQNQAQNAKLPTPDPDSPIQKHNPSTTPASAQPTNTTLEATSRPSSKGIVVGDVRVRFTFPGASEAHHADTFTESQLKQLSDELIKRAHRAEKPDPVGKPIVWSESRRELCETLPYYRSYKAGGYISDGIAHAFMFDKEAHPRDYIDSSVIIARAGGGMVRDRNSGAMVLGKDQDETAQIKALNRNMTELRPVGIIAGKNLSNIQSKMAHTYQFLDWFKPADMWCEKVNGHVAVRYRFEKLRQQDSSWWSPAGEPAEVPELLGDVELVPVSRSCQSCSTVSMQVYLNGWICLYPACDKFWQFADGRVPVDDELRYDPRFLKRRTKWPNTSTPWETKPNPFAWSTDSVAGEAQREELVGLTKSIACPKCGRCTAAKYWTYWLCGNHECGHKVLLPDMPISKSGLRELTYSISDGYSFSRDVYDHSIKVETSFKGNFRQSTYTFPGLPGCYVAHLHANKTIVEEEGGADDMFLDLQSNEIGLERRAKDDSRLAGENLCDHFTLNFGMPYKFVASPDSRPFSKAPKSVAMARSQLIWASKALGIIGEEDFNELMVLGYKTANKIGYHDDGEEGLGPTIATLSVGCPADMKLKMQDKYYRGFTGKDDKGEVKTKTFTDKLPPIPGCNRYEERLAAYNELVELKEIDPTAYKAKKKSLPQELGLTDARTNKGPPEVLKMRLAHGDIVVMHGALLQTYYVHCVEPKGNMRFAFTCRNILQNHLKEEERPGYEIEPDEIKYDGYKLPLPG